MIKYILGGVVYLTLLSNTNATTVNWKFERVVDGDTILFTVDEFPIELNKVYIRIDGVDTPESNHMAKCQKERQLGIAAKYFLSSVANRNNTVVVIKKWDKYGGRVLADVYVDGMSVKDLMIAKNYAKPYYGEKKHNWCG